MMDVMREGVGKKWCIYKVAFGGDMVIVLYARIGDNVVFFVRWVDWGSMPTERICDHLNVASCRAGQVNTLEQGALNI